jgi:hypothetical protein
MAELLELSDMAGVHTTGRLNRIGLELNQRLQNWNQAEHSADSSSKLDSSSFGKELRLLDAAMETLRALRRSLANRSYDSVDRHLRDRHEQLETLFKRLEQKLIKLATRTEGIDVRQSLSEAKTTQPPGYGQSASSSGQVPAAQTLGRLNNQPLRQGGSRYLSIG